MSRRHLAVFELDESGAWIVSVPSIPGCHTYGRSLAQARRRLREALGLWIERPESVQLEEDVRLPTGAKQALRRTAAARSKADAERERAQQATAEVARFLVQDLQLGMRDAGELLGVSFQRVHQLLADQRQMGSRA